MQEEEKACNTNGEVIGKKPWQFPMLQQMAQAKTVLSIFMKIQNLQSIGKPHRSLLMPAPCAQTKTAALLLHVNASWGKDQEACCDR